MIIYREVDYISVCGPVWSVLVCVCRNMHAPFRVDTISVLIILVMFIKNSNASDSII
jgi:hypothetical protein